VGLNEGVYEEKRPYCRGLHPGRETSPDQSPKKKPEIGKRTRGYPGESRRDMSA